MTIQAYKGRDPHSANRIAVYRNLHADAWSLMALDGPNAGTVVAHANSLVLDLPVFKVSEQGRQRVIAEKAKNVHAMVAGLLADVQSTEVPDDSERVTYNPYRAGHFYLADNGAPVTAARLAVFTSNGKVWAV